MPDVRRATVEWADDDQRQLLLDNGQLDFATAGENQVARAARSRNGKVLAHGCYLSHVHSRLALARSVLHIPELLR